MLSKPRFRAPGNSKTRLESPCLETYAARAWINADQLVR